MTDPTTRRLGELLGADVERPDGTRAGHVQDVRFQRAKHDPQRLAIAGLVVAQRATGALLGYDRERTRGPWPIRTLVRWLHRHALYVPWEDIDGIDWDNHVVHVHDGEFERLRDLH